jgi:hypothetical protein
MTRTGIHCAGAVHQTGTQARQVFAIGAPDCLSAGLFEGQEVEFAGWTRASYDGLAQLLGGAFPGDVVTEDLLSQADLVAFEMNGTSPAFSGGWESCDFVFKDSQSSLVVPWRDGTLGNVLLGTPIPRDPHVIANGSITGAAYGRFFGIPDAAVTRDVPQLTPDQVVVSFLLLRVRGEIDITGPAFRLGLRGIAIAPESPTATPDPDAIGVLHHGLELPVKPVKPKQSAAQRVLTLCRSFGVSEAILPALSVIWGRHLAGLDGRNDFEAVIHRSFEQLPEDEHTALAAGFAGFGAFRQQGLDNCFFTDQLAVTLADHPLTAEAFTKELIREGSTVAEQRFFDNTQNDLSPGLVRPWRTSTGAISETPGPAKTALLPTPWLTAIRPDPGNFAEYGNNESFIAPPGQTHIFEDYQFDKVCALHPQTDGSVLYRCDPVRPPANPGSFVSGDCTGGPLYTFGNTNCLLIPAQSAGAAISLRGFNFFTPQ